jgi:hypothetical protein
MEHDETTGRSEKKKNEMAITLGPGQVIPAPPRVMHH